MLSGMTKVNWQSGTKYSRGLLALNKRNMGEAGGWVGCLHLHMFRLRPPETSGAGTSIPAVCLSAVGTVNALFEFGHEKRDRPQSSRINPVKN